MRLDVLPGGASFILRPDMADFSVKAFFGGDTTGLKSATDEASGIVSGFAQTTQGVMAAVGASILGAFAVEAIAEKLTQFFESAIQGANKLAQVSNELNIGTKELQAWNFAVEESGASQEKAQQALEHTRLAVDQLRDGVPTATKAFADLGLSASDLIGLNLDQQLQKIAAAYVENSDKAGAYQAITEILGRRSAPELMAALVQLGNEGFGGLTKNAEQFGQVTSTQAISAIHDLSQAAVTTGNGIKVLFQELFGGILSGFQVLGGLEAAAFNWLTGVKTDWDTVFLSEQKATDAAAKHAAQLDLVAQATAKARDAAIELALQYETQAKNLAAVATGTEKIKDLEQLRAQLAEDIGQAGLTEQQIKEKTNEYTAAGVEIDKTKLQIQNQLNEANTKEYDTYDKLFHQVDALNQKVRFESLPLSEQIAELEQQRETLLEEQGKTIKDSTDYLNDQMAIDKIDLDLNQLKTKEIKDQTAAIKAAADAQKEAAATAAWGKPVSALGMSNLGSQSTDVLQATAGQLQATLANLKQNFVPSFTTMNVNEDLGYAYTSSQLASIQNELTFRQQFTAELQQGGRSGALADWTQQGRDPLSFQTAINNMSSWGGNTSDVVTATQQLGTQLTAISNTLKNALG